MNLRKKPPSFIVTSFWGTQFLIISINLFVNVWQFSSILFSGDIRKRDRLRKLARRSNSDSNINKYKKQRNHVNNLKKHAKEQFYFNINISIWWLMESRPDAFPNFKICKISRTLLGVIWKKSSVAFVLRAKSGFDVKAC
jgi:hypothetical protein